VQALLQRPPEQSPLAAALSVAVVPWYVVLHKEGWVGGWCEICSVLYLSSIYVLYLNLYLVLYILYVLPYLYLRLILVSIYYFKQFAQRLFITRHPRTGVASSINHHVLVRCVWVFAGGVCVKKLKKYVKKKKKKHPITTF